MAEILSDLVVLAKGKDIVARDIVGETILVPIRGKLADMQKIYTLDRMGKNIWEKIDGKTNLKAILESILETYDVQREEASLDLKEFAADLMSAGLLEAVPD